MTLETDSERSVDLVGALAVAIEAMALLTLLPWEGVLREDYMVAAGQIREAIFFYPTAAPDADDQMESQHMVIGLFVGCLRMSAGYNDRSYETTVHTKIRGNEVGAVYIRRRTHPFIANVSNSQLIVSENGTIESSKLLEVADLKADFGTITDPEEPDFTIKFQYTLRPGPRDPRDLLLAVLDALANAAPHEFNDRLETLEGKDTSSSTMATCMVKMTVPPARHKILTYRYAVRATKLIARLMILTNRIGVLDFQLLYEGEKFGDGSISRLRSLLDNTAQNAAVS